METHYYSPCEIRGPNLLIARRCKVCGALATAEYGDERVMGRLPEACRREHGNVSVEIPVEVPNARRRRMTTKGEPKWPVATNIA